MKKGLGRYLAIFSLAGLSGALLLHTSQSVQQAEDRLARLQGAVENERETIRVLTAEWNYLNRPDYLESLATEYLGFRAPESDTLIAGPESVPDHFAPVLPPPLPAARQMPQMMLIAAEPEETPVHNEEDLQVPPASQENFHRLLDNLKKAEGRP